MSLQRSLDSLTREHTEAAVATIVEIMNDPDMEPKDRLKAAQEILDRGHGKPLSATISLPPSKVMQARIAAMSDDELLDEVRSHELPRLEPRTVVPQARTSTPPLAPQDFSDDPLLK